VWPIATPRGRVTTRPYKIDRSIDRSEEGLSMAKTFRVGFGVRFSNALVAALLSIGVRTGPMRLLTVRGRKSGQPRTTPVAIVEQEGRRWVISPYGQVDWVRNLRAAGRATLRRGRQTEMVTATELSPEEAAPLLKESLAVAPSFLRAYFDVAPDASIEAFEREAPRHPVFLLGAATAA
jgi:deazaflavin-dependent oxidoreductase (nitroreductase family)